ncbi:MAG: phage holin [Ruminococcus sp.]|nr:phage holin [Ruminococcus sp.]
MKVSGQTIARTAVLAAALLNQILVLFGINPLPFSDNGVYETVSLVFTAAASIRAWWKNNSFTQSAIKADKCLNEIRGGKNEFSK